ncbi:UbiD family decarboxylase [Actinocrispum wychmicini]|uniref:2,5-furandicarboxylate decarboxylase 1 n=1 Tax=Actinocrispum wychmicini TaxID=1213861 RepID=A0A4R2JJ15_9PSEU|nr:UbiD family decarboxylase [Actinocrispum wychmicini]TCO59923.1 2,5-furandicarboxylate decarboxylase 1 [Actinocrispum wychmicini]
MPKDLRTFLNDLPPEQLKVVDKPVSPDFEVTAIVDRMEKDPAYPGFPAVLFRDVGGSDIPLLINLHGTYERLARSVDADVHSMVEQYARREGSGIPPTLVDNAPVQEIVLTGDDIDVRRLPMIIHQEMDAGRYITSAVTLCRDPSSRKINAGIFRHQYQEPDQVGIQVNPAHHTAYVMRELREQGKPMEVALVIGHHPALLMGAVSKLEGIGGELDVVGGLLGEPLEMVRCKTVDLEVPARAEIVIEGVIDTDPEATRVEGPFGEYPRFYTRVGPQPYVKITAITMRRRPIYVDVFNAHTEHSMLGGLPRMGSIYRRVKEAVPSVVGVNLPLSGMARSHLYISMRKRVEGEPKLAACAALAVDPLLKHVFIVDDDVDIFDEVATLWCLATRFQGDRDLTIMPNFLGGQLNPVTYGYRREEKGPMETKLIFDCTKPAAPEKFPQSCRVPADVVARMSPRDYLLDVTLPLVPSSD